MLRFAVFTGFEDYKGKFENGCITKISSNKGKGLEMFLEILKQEVYLYIQDSILHL